MTDLPTVFVVPAEGLIVLDPETRQPIPASGASVPKTSYWVRRLADGDVLERTEDLGPPTTNQRPVPERTPKREE